MSLSDVRERVQRNYNDGISDTYEQVGADRHFLLAQLDEAVALLRRASVCTTVDEGAVWDDIDAYLAQLGEGKE